MVGVAVSWLVDMWPASRAPPRQPRRDVAGATYSGRAHNCRNVIFRRPLSIHRIFERSCELGVFCLTADVIVQIFGVRKHKRLRGKFHTMLEKLDHGHHVLRIYCKALVGRLYEKFGTFLRVEVCVNRLKDLGLNKNLDQLPALRQKLIEVTDRLATAHADYLNVHVEFPLFQRVAQPLTAGRTRIPGIKIHDTRMVRLMEVFLHHGSQLAGWRNADLHHAVLDAFGLTAQTYSITQLRYDVRKLKAHGLVQRDGRRYRYHLTEKGRKIAALFVLFHKRICGPVAHTLFDSAPIATTTVNSPAKIEAAYHHADAAIQRLIDLAAA